jgi:hypothetical protein
LLLSDMDVQLQYVSVGLKKAIPLACFVHGMCCNTLRWRVSGTSAHNRPVPLGLQDPHRISDYIGIYAGQNPTEGGYRPRAGSCCDCSQPWHVANCGSATDRSAPVRCAKLPSARPCLRPDAENFGGEVSFQSLHGV